MYKVYGTQRSRAFRVLWALEELGQPYELIEAQPRSEAIRAVYPAGKIPALQVGDDVLSDSTAIMTFLADRHGGLTYPAGSIERGRQDALTNRLNDEFDAVLWTAARHSMILPEERRTPGVVDTCKWEFEQSAARLSEDFAGPFLMGDTMTIADILAVHCLSWAKGFGFPEVSDTLSDYARRMRARPAFVATAAKTPS